VTYPREKWAHCFFSSYRAALEATGKPFLCTNYLLKGRGSASLSDVAMSEFDVKYAAQLARLHLTPAEEQKLGTQLGNILGYIEKLRELDVSQVQPTAHAVPLVNVARPDEVRLSLPHEEALRNAPAKAGGLFIVPKIVE
jgi:aspartyl-tRNA(Asn)/glutamyl-tRNA(Gln) amidotransferase subunit C